MQIGILEPDGFDVGAADRLANLGQVAYYGGDDLAAFLGSVDVLFVRLGYRIDDLFLQHAPRLRYLCSPTTSHTHLDEAALSARGIEVISLRGERQFLDTVRATPEHTFGLVLALLRRYKTALRHVQQGGWCRDDLRGEELFGQTVGIVGLGRVGFRVATYATAFGADVVYCDTNLAVTADAAWRRCADIRSVIQCSRIVVLCASYVNGSPPVVGAEEVRALSGRYFVNTARGELVDEQALLAAIFDNRLAGVAVDVIANETCGSRIDEWRRAASRSDVIVTPHIGGATVGSMARTERFIAARLEKRIKVAE